MRNSKSRVSGVHKSRNESEGSGVAFPRQEMQNKNALPIGMLFLSIYCLSRPSRRVFPCKSDWLGMHD
jgi:hypothetical protein